MAVLVVLAGAVRACPPPSHQPLVPPPVLVSSSTETQESLCGYMLLNQILMLLASVIKAVAVAFAFAWPPTCLAAPCAMFHRLRHQAPLASPSSLSYPAHRSPYSPSSAIHAHAFRSD